MASLDLHRRRRFRTALVPFLASIAITASGCAATAGDAGNSPVLTPQNAPAFKIIPEPALSASDVSPLERVQISVTSGELKDVQLTNEVGKAVAGELSDDAQRWVITEPLGFSRTYTWSGTARNPDGEKFPISGSFSTLTPDGVVSAFPNVIENGSYGSSHEIVVNFDADITEKVTVRRLLTVTSDPTAKGTWAWESDRTLRWSPRTEWPSGAEATVSADLYGVRMAEGLYGASNLNVSFRIQPS